MEKFFLRFMVAKSAAITDRGAQIWGTKGKLEGKIADGIRAAFSSVISLELQRTRSAVE